MKMKRYHPKCDVTELCDPVTFKKFIAQLSRKLLSPNMLGIDIRMRGKPSSMLNDLITLKKS